MPPKPRDGIMEKVYIVAAASAEPDDHLDCRNHA
jgi:hypothetical protein